MKQLIWAIIMFVGSVILFAILETAYQSFFNPSKKDQIESALKKVSQETNKNCPIIMNKYTTLISTSAQGDSLKMWYHFDAEKFYEEEGLTVNNVEMLEHDAKIKEFCGPEAKGLRSMDAKMKVTYRDIDNSYLFNFKRK